jgi:hypothetical protein
MARLLSCRRLAHARVHVRQLVQREGYLLSNCCVEPALQHGRPNPHKHIHGPDNQPGARQRCRVREGVPRCARVSGMPPPNAHLGMASPNAHLGKGSPNAHTLQRSTATAYGPLPTTRRPWSCSRPTGMDRTDQKDKHSFVLWMLVLTIMEPESCGLIFLAPQTWFCMK